MDLGSRIALLVAALVVAGVGWTVLQTRRGRVRPAARTGQLPAAWSSQAGDALTLVQLSSSHCSACVRSARIWREALADTSGVAFLEVDAETHLDVVRDLGVLTTPTTLVYDGAGALSGRVTGAPTPRQAAEALSQPIGAAR